MGLDSFILPFLPALTSHSCILDSGECMHMYYTGYILYMPDNLVPHFQLSLL